MTPLRLVCILGPTGTGKTSAALSLGRPVGVVNFDSRQIYEDFSIITAQPDEEERARAPHHLYGFLSCREPMNAARMADLAVDAAKDVAARDMLPVLVGGTGMYLRALLEGIAPIPEIPPDVRASVLTRLENEGPQKLHAELSTVDPDYAAVIHPNDSQRNARAAEVFAATGKTMTHWHKMARPTHPVAALKIGVRADLAGLTPKLVQRIDAMIEAGAVQEARAAWEKCPDPKAPAWSGIGCAELLRHITGEISLSEARDLWIRNTRAYAKRQITWCNKERDMVWFEAGDCEGMAKAVADWL